MNVRDIEVLIFAISHHFHQTSLMVRCGYSRLQYSFTYACGKWSSKYIMLVEAVVCHRVRYRVSHSLFYRLKLQARNIGLLYTST